jgi:hypothetical protein
MQPRGQSCPRVEGQDAKKEVFFVHRTMDFHFYSILVFAHNST